ncbi:MAG: cation diffusion facilitator family transporter [Defluviitaleaceae bacterium]|nr:cation diffusion facilitator family transporter [Defluviitaleaceae bacterium]
MLSHESKIKTIKKASVITVAGNLFLSLLKIIFGILSNSSALVADGIDSAADVLVGIIALVVVRVISKPADKTHPWGHGRAETVAAAILSFILFFVGAQLIVNGVSDFFSGEQKIAPAQFALAVTAVSIAAKILLAANQYMLGKRADSAMIKANAKNMASDALVSVSVLAGLLISFATGSAYADSVIAVLIGAWIIKTAVGIFLESNLELMDGSDNLEPYRAVVEAVNAVEGASNPHRARMRRISGFWDIDLDIGVNPKCTVSEAHAIASRVEDEIKRRIENVFDAVIHVEPWGDETSEAYGLSEDDMEG